MSNRQRFYTWRDQLLVAIRCYTRQVVRVEGVYADQMYRHPDDLSAAGRAGRRAVTVRAFVQLRSLEMGALNALDGRDLLDIAARTHNVTLAVWS